MLPCYHFTEFNLKIDLLLTCLVDPFAEADEDTGQVQQSQKYIHIRIQRTAQKSHIEKSC